MSRIQRVLVAATLSALPLSTLALPSHALAADSGSAPATEYVVKPGDFLAGIAAKVGVTLADLLGTNNLTTKSLILPGQKLALPAKATVPATSTGSVGPVAGSLVYTIKSGDFLLGIATSYHVTLADLLAVNKLTVRSLILPGRALKMPANAVAPVAASVAVETTSTPQTSSFASPATHPSNLPGQRHR